ncbi:MAG: helix-turn-helix domain-containing protein [Clostridiales bacterium]|nr:helix-turn-helix domain-containing protein [Clostridiales bacterium]
MLDSMGERIKERRVALGYTLEELAGKVGVGASTVRKWEIGYIKDMRSDKIQKVAAALEVTPAYLMGWEENQSVNVEQVHTNNGLIGQANAPVHINNENTPVRLSKEETELLRIYGELSVRDRMKLLTFAMDLEAKELES